MIKLHVYRSRFRSSYQKQLNPMLCKKALVRNIGLCICSLLQSVMVTLPCKSRKFKHTHVYAVIKQYDLIMLIYEILFLYSLAIKVSYPSIIMCSYISCLFTFGSRRHFELMVIYPSLEQNKTYVPY